MKTYSSSIIKLHNTHCPKAVAFYEDGAPQDTSQTAYGVASHATIQECGQKNARTPEDQQIVGDAVARELIVNGRTFRGRKEPPMQLDHAFYGRDVALNYLRWNELPEFAYYEVEFKTILEGEQKSFELVALHDCAWLDDQSDDISSRKFGVTTDWKGWQGREEELDTIQRKAQAVTLFDNTSNDHNDGLRVEIVNLQTHRKFAREILLDDDGIELIEQYRKDLYLACVAVDSTREARPGVGCLSCPYNHLCTDRLRLKPADANAYKKQAEYLTWLETERKLCIQMLKESLELPVEIRGGYVGWKRTPADNITDDAIGAMYDQWFGNQETPSRGEIRGLLKAIGLGKANINNFVKNVWGKELDDMAQDFIATSVKPHKQRQFGVWKGEPE